ncbi:MAG: type II secretion system F family protein [Spirochaetes bacterium]|nr:type II secretion system F family protein [Spirochaetota bacterium]
MVYEYQALTRKGSKVSDLIDAPSELSAKQKLKSKGLYVVRIARHEGISKDKETSKNGSINRLFTKAQEYFSLKLSSKQIGIFSRQLSTLLNAGMPLLVAMTDIIDQIENKHFKRIIVDIKEKLEEGSSLSNCLARHSNVFSDMYINMVRVGENMGSLDQVIERLAELQEKKNVLKSKVQSALYYPAFLSLFAFAVIIFLMVSAVPALARIFADMGRELPLPTKIVLWVSGLLTNLYFTVPFITAIIVIIYMLNRYIKTPEGKKKADELKLKLPVIRTFYKKIIILNFTQNMGILLNNRVDILKSFEIVKKIVRNIIIEKQIEEVAKKVKEGSSVSNALSKSEFLPKLVLGMINAGESSDQLDAMLIKIGNVYETEMDMTLSGLTSLIEPVIILFLGVVMALIIVSVLLPIFEMNLMV